ncbi:hypothetical protein D3C71_2060570 [compost metagenome]
MIVVPEIVQPEAEQVTVVLPQQKLYILGETGFEHFIRIEAQNPLGVCFDDLIPLLLAQLRFIAEPGDGIAH